MPTADASYRADADAMLFLEHMSRGDTLMKELLIHSVARALSLKVDAGRSLVWHMTRHGTAICHIWDWLEASIINDVPWLRNLDTNGCPKKLLKCRDIDALVREADKDMRKQNAAIARKPLADGEELLEFQCAEGWSIVRLLTSGALDRESVAMQHCIGNGAYDERLGNDDFRYFSLRDPAGKPHGTMEVKGSTLLQFQGKQNAVPVEKYRRIALPFLAEKRIDCSGARCGLVTDAAGQTYLDIELPEELVVSGCNLVLTSTAEKRMTLPKVMRIEGRLTLIGVFENIPDCIVVDGD